jgi:NADH-quinone oxidoreductase subunit L
MLLSLGAIFAGLLPFASFVTSDGKPLATHIDFRVAIPAILVGVLGALTAMVFYRKETNIPEKISGALGGFYRAAYRKFYVDELYLFITRKIIFNHISRPIAWFDRHIVDGSMNGISYVTNEVSARIKNFQSGQLQQYAWVFVTGAVALALAFIYLWTN